MARTSMIDVESGENGFYRRSRSTSAGSKHSASFMKSGSIDLTSSQESTSSELFQRSASKDFLEASLTSQTSVQTLTTPGSAGMATYINVEFMQKRAESSGSEIDEDILKPPGERARDTSTSAVMDPVEDPSPSPPPALPLQSSNMETAAALDSQDFAPTPFDDPLPDLDATLTFTEHEIFSMYDYPSQMTDLGSTAVAEEDMKEEDDMEAGEVTPTSPAYHNYANMEFFQVNNLLSQSKQAAVHGEEEGSSSKGPKKPMPIQRKTKSTASQFGLEEVSKSTTRDSPVRNLGLKKPAPPVKPSYLINQDSESPLSSPKIQQQQGSTPPSSAANLSKPHPTIPALSKFLTSAATTTAYVGSGGGGRGEERASDDSVVGTDPSAAATVPPASTKPRSHTTIEHSTVASKQPILPPATRYRSKSRSPSPVVSPDTTPKHQPQTQLPPAPTKEKKEESKEGNKIVLTSVPLLVKKPALKPQVSEPVLGNRTRPVVATASSTLNRPNKPIYTSYGGKFSRNMGGGVGNRANHAPSSNTSSDQDELMKKLTLRRLKIDEQLGAVTKSPNAPPFKSNSPTFQKHSSPSISPQTPHRISAPLGHKSALNVSSSSTRSGGADTPSERNSTISTSSSEVIVSYRNLDESSSTTSLSSNGTSSHSMDGGVGGNGMFLRKPEDGGYGNDTKETNLAKYGIIEEGGSYVI